MSINYSDERFDGVKVAADWVRDLESDDSRLHKERVIEKALVAAKLGSSEAQCFLFNCYQSYNPYYTFNIRQVPESEGLTNMPNPWTAFWAMLENLRTRGVTGNQAREDVEHMMHLFDSVEWNGLARRVLLRDLRCGISEKTLNKVLGKTEWAIPVFTCQLAQDSTDHPKKLKGQRRLEHKLDGVRVLALINILGCTLYSRNGKIFENFKEIQEHLSTQRYHLMDRIKMPFGASEGIILDGEIVGESFQKLMKQAHRKSDANTTGMVYHVFDLIPVTDFRRGHYNRQQNRRLDVLEKLTPSLDSGLVQLMPGITVDLDLAEGHDIMRRFAEDSVAQGYEGIMIKDLEAPYECRRSSFWMKWKPVITVDLDVVDMEEGTGKNLGRLGALVCEGVDNGRRIRVNVGSGLSDSDRDQYWMARDSVLGRVVEVQADAVTQNQDGTYSLRFPRFVRFRGFEAGEKL